MSDLIICHNTVNKKHIAKALSVVFDEKNEIPAYLIKMILERLLWATTENSDDTVYRKYLGQPYWSISAIKQYRKNLQDKTQKNKFDDLRHEHAVPKKIIISKILASDKSEEAIFKILSTFGYAVIVSREEDEKLTAAKVRSKMPGELLSNTSYANIFSRYGEAEIEIVDVRIYDLKKIQDEDLITLQRKSLTPKKLVQ